MKLYFIRHAECVKKGDEVILTEKRKMQAQYLANRLTKLKIDKIYVSTATRALQTAEPFIGLKHDIIVVKTAMLREIYRTLVGGPPKENAQHNREQEDKKRAEAIIKDLYSHYQEHVVVFSHGNLIRYIIAHILNFKATQLWTKIVISPASITLIEKEREFVRIKMINNIEHLDAEELEKFYKEPLTEENYFP